MENAAAIVLDLVDLEHYWAYVLYTYWSMSTWRRARADRYRVQEASEACCGAATHGTWGGQLYRHLMPVCTLRIAGCAHHCDEGVAAPTS